VIEPKGRATRRSALLGGRSSGLAAPLPNAMAKAVDRDQRLVAAPELAL
jgi:hypothetical protein